MLAYLVLVNQNGSPVEPELIRRLEQIDPPEVHFAVEEHLSWSNPAGTVHLLGWQAFTNFASMGSHWAVDDDGLTAFAGHLWPHENVWQHPEESWARQLRGYLGHTGPVNARESLFGAYSIVSLAADGRGWITTDFMAIGQLFIAEADGVVAVSNRASLAARAVTPPDAVPQRSVLAAGWLPCYGSVFDDESGFWDVARVPCGAHVEIDPRKGATLTESARSPLAPSDVGSFPTDYEDILPLVEHDLRRTLRNIAELPISDLELRLSGGKDSRLLTALLISEGLTDRFRFVTVGPPDKSDPLVARQIAERYGLDWTLDDRSARRVEEEFERVRSHAFQVEGMTSAWDAAGETVFSPGATVSGTAGECLRWGSFSLAGSRVRDEDELIALMRAKCRFDPAGILTPEARAYYFQSLETWTRNHLHRGEDPQRIAAFFSRGVHAHSRAGPNFSNDPRTWISPFVTPVCARANHRLSAAHRPDARFQVDIMRKCDVALSKMPFADTPWPEESIAHLPDADDYRAILPVVSKSPSAQNWRVVRYEDYLPLLETWLIDRANPLFEVIDYDQLRQRVQTGASNVGRVRVLWGAMTAAVWMSGHESTHKIVRRPVSTRRH